MEHKRSRRIIANTLPPFLDGVGSSRPSLRFRDKRYELSKRLLLIVLSVIIVGLYVFISASGTVPKNIQQAVSFPIYYPRSLPAGYMLDVKSFRLPEEGVVLYTVKYGEGKDIVVSEQEQPSANDIDKFVTAYIPLNTELNLPIGRAKIGAYGTAPNIRTAISLPVKNGPWLIITAPSDISRDDLIHILESLNR